MNVSFTDTTSMQSHARKSGRLSDHMQRLHEPSSLTIVCIASQPDTELPLVLARTMLSVSHSHQAILPRSATRLGDYTAHTLHTHCSPWCQPEHMLLVLVTHLLQRAFDCKFLLGITLACNLYHGRKSVFAHIFRTYICSRTPTSRLWYKL